MDVPEEVLLVVFQRLREHLVNESEVGLALKGEGRDFTLRVRRRKSLSTEKQPYFALVVAPRDGGYRVSFRRGGVPSAESRVILVDGGTAEELFDLAWGCVTTERERLGAFRDA